MLEQLAASELLPEQSLLDKALEEIVEKIDKPEMTCKKVMILIEKSRTLEESKTYALKWVKNKMP